MRAALVLLLVGGLALQALAADPPKPSPTKHTGRAIPAPADCTACHQETGWQHITFDHDTTGMPLRDAHAGVACRVCHQDVKRLTLDNTCFSCHQDVHQGRLGKACQRCHDQRTFRSGAGVEAHGQTRFPLFARHALVPCDKCHQNRADRTFQGVPVTCEGCHQVDAARTQGGTRDHTSLGAAPECRTCHTPVGWTPARFADHDRCFPITSGPHQVGCTQCHTALAGLDLTGCNSFTAACSKCHFKDRNNGGLASTDAQHRAGTPNAVAGYQFVDRKCYECHTGSRR